MADIIKMDYDAVQNMSATCGDASETMDDLIQALNNISNTLEGGALLGKGGDALAGAVRDRLVPAINRMKDKFNELELDLQGALSDLRDEDHEAGGRFSK